eukprot:TRINITY_DN14697_c0_g1_i1.p1 TRINITY_DN14697_c0_g1~~TRINITY_DN14697_c0_g1_i1.p1  ORF type:complete len:514 (+),score=105.31 TRINITY_DN14697_c0_g1_i1:50-1591(+)
MNDNNNNNTEYSIVDWGTTSVRSYRIIGDRVVEENENANGGVLSCDGTDFERVLTEMVGHWSGDIYLIGMVGSSIGWKEVKHIPTPASPQDVWSRKVKIHHTTHPDLTHRTIFVIPGITDPDTDDVMRGEETQLFGTNTNNGIVICPGTHCKWVLLKHGSISSFTTFMSGELFALLKERSILSKSIPHEGDNFDQLMFQTGVSEGFSTSSFLSAIFRVRTKSLRGTLPASKAASYLSGILIGSEIREGCKVFGSELQNQTTIKVTGNLSLCRLYKTAIEKVTTQTVTVIPSKDVLVKGISLMKQPNMNLTRIVAILRGVSPAEVVAVGKSLIDGGIRCLEVPLNTPFALKSIKLLSNEFSKSDVLIGAGTVLSVEQVRQVAEVGGTLIVSPNVDAEVIRETRRLGLVSVPGFFTPTEAFVAISCGCNALKYFPAESATPVGLKALRAVLPPHIPVFAVGGVSLSNLATWKESGAFGYGIGTSLYKPGRSPQQVFESASNFSRSVSNLFGGSKL